AYDALVMAPAGGLPKRKIPGANADTVTDCCNAPYADWTRSVCAPGVTARGTSALIWNAVGKYTRMGTPSISTVVALPGPERPLPKMDTTPPGAMPGVKVAPPTTPPTAKLTSCVLTVKFSFGRVTL